MVAFPFHAISYKICFPIQHHTHKAFKVLKWQIETFSIPHFYGLHIFHSAKKSEIPLTQCLKNSLLSTVLWRNNILNLFFVAQQVYVLFMFELEFVRWKKILFLVVIRLILLCLYVKCFLVHFNTQKRREVKLLFLNQILRIKGLSASDWWCGKEKFCELIFNQQFGLIFMECGKLFVDAFSMLELLWKILGSDKVIFILNVEHPL